MDGLDQGARLAPAQRRHGRQKFDNGTNASIVMHVCIILLKCHKNFSILYSRHPHVRFRYNTHAQLPRFPTLMSLGTCYGCENWCLCDSSLKILNSFLGELCKRILKLPKWYSNTASVIVTDCQQLKQNV